MQWRRREGLSSFPVLPLSKSVCLGLNPRQPDEAGGFPFQALLIASPGPGVIPPFLTGLIGRTYAANLSFSF